MEHLATDSLSSDVKVQNYLQGQYAALVPPERPQNTNCNLSFGMKNIIETALKSYSFLTNSLLFTGRKLILKKNYPKVISSLKTTTRSISC